jgi:3-deoxy-D-manno-octulosonic-acid transferase
MIEILYRGLTAAGAPALRLWLEARQRRGKEDPLRLGERMGVASRARPPGAVIWMHAASVGEALSVMPLAAALRARWPAVSIVFTSGTVSSARLMAERLPAGCIHQYAPVDVPAWVDRFLDHWRPGAVLWIESEFWPNSIAAIRRRGLPLALVNARLSPKSFERWRLAAPLIRPPLDAFAPCLAQDETIAARLVALGGRAVSCLGNLKFDAEPLPADAEELARLQSALAGRPAWLAASIQPGEAPAVIAAHQALAARHKDLITLVVPRHPQRGADIAEVARSAGLTAARRGAGTLPDAATDIYLGDTLGELGLFYRLAKPVFIGGSLVPHGGQNPLEAARLDTALVLGPQMFNFPEVTSVLLAAGGAEQIADAAALAPAIDRLLGDPALVAQRAQAARAIADSGRGTVERVLKALDPLLAPLAGRETDRAGA